jgi:hypothetical protein
MMSSQRLRVTLGVFIALVVIAISGLTITLVSRVFARLTPALHEDLVGKTRLGAHNLAQATQYGIVLADPGVIHTSLVPFEDPDLIAIVVTDESGHLLVAEGVAVDASTIFSGPPESVRALRPGLVSWSPAIIEGRTIGKVAVAVSTARLEDGERLRREMVIATAAACLGALVLSLYFVAFYLGPVIKVTELAIADLRDLNVTLESRVERRTSELSDANTQLGASLQAQQEMQQRLVDASRLTGMADVATAVLHNVGNVLNSVNVSVEVATETLVRSKTAGADEGRRDAGERAQRPGTLLHRRSARPEAAGVHREAGRSGQARQRPGHGRAEVPQEQCRPHQDHRRHAAVARQGRRRDGDPRSAGAARGAPEVQHRHLRK